MKVWLIRLCLSLGLLACAACSNSTSTPPSGSPDPNARPDKPKSPPALPKPPADAPRR